MTGNGQRYRGLLLAGAGSVGRAVLQLGGGLLAHFDRIALLDRSAERLAAGAADDAIVRLSGDITEPTTLARALRSLPEPAIVVNLCAGVDTVAMRLALRDWPAAYIDAGASQCPDPTETRFSRLMPYTLQPTHGRFPHLLCQGINPGLVEVVALSLMGNRANEPRSMSVVVLEEDTLHVPHSNGRLVCGWSPRDLMDEVLCAPTLQVADGRIVEFEEAGSLEIRLANGSGGAPARAVAHEDTWNLAGVAAVSHAVFLYRLHGELMSALREAPGSVAERLTMPEPDDPLQGSDRITVAVSHLPSGTVRAARWSVDHGESWRESGLSGVQVQTAKGILFAIAVLLRSPLGQTPGTFTASTMCQAGWDGVVPAELFAELGIDWQPVAGFTLAGAEPGPLHVHPADPLWH